MRSQVRYQLMNKDEVVAVYEEREGLADFHYEEVEVCGTYLLHGFIGIDD